MAEKTLHELLRRHEVKKGTPATHTSLCPGRRRGYNFATEADEEALLVAYSAALEAVPDGSQATFHLTEQPIAGALPLLVDIDLRWPSAERRYTPESIAAFVQAHTQCVRRFLTLPPEVDWFVLEKPAPRVNKAAGASGGVFKDGVHLMAPQIVTGAQVQRAIRDSFLAERPGFFEGLSTTKAADVFDESVLGRNGWFLLGSRKGDEPNAWAISHILRVNTVTLAMRVVPVEELPLRTTDMVRALSIRLVGPAASLTDQGALTIMAPPVPPVKARRRTNTIVHVDVPATPASMSKRVEGVCVHEACELTAMLSATRAERYDDWIRVGWCLHNIASEELLPSWVAFSKRCPAKFEEGVCEHLWPAMRSSGLGMGSLHLWARLDDPQAYKAFVGSRMNAELMACDGSHNSVAAVAYKILGHLFVCGSGDGKYWYSFNGTLWCEDVGTLAMRRELSTTVREHFTAAMHRQANSLSIDDMQSDTSATTATRANKASCEKLLGIAFNLRNKSFKDAVMVELREFFYKPDFVATLDSDPNLLAFSNGVWDLCEKAFRPASPEDRLSLSVGYDYVPIVDDAKYAKMQAYWAQLQPEPAARTYVVSTLARQLYGDVGANLLHIHAGHRGSAGNGKSTLWEVIEVSLGDYVRKFDVAHLTAKQRPEMGKPQPTFGTWRGRRLLYCAEPNDDEAINSGIMKDMTGGECVQYRLLHSNEIVQFRPQFKVHLMCNDAPPFQGGDRGNQRRLRKVDYLSRFVEADEVDEDARLFLRDDTFIQAVRDDTAWRMEFLRVLLHAYDHAYAFEMPASVRENSKVYAEENNKVMMFVQDCIVKREGEFFLLKAARVAFTTSSHNSGKIATLKRELEKVLGVVCKAQAWKNGRPVKNVFEGFALLADEDDSFHVDDVLGD